MVEMAAAVVGAAMLVALGELARRAALGRRLERELHRERPRPSWRVLGAEAELRPALQRAVADEEQSAWRAWRHRERAEHRARGGGPGVPPAPRVPRAS